MALTAKQASNLALKPMDEETSINENVKRILGQIYYFARLKYKSIFFTVNDIVSPLNLGTITQLQKLGYNLKLENNNLIVSW